MVLGILFRLREGTNSRNSNPFLRAKLYEPLEMNLTVGILQQVCSNSKKDPEILVVIQAFFFSANALESTQVKCRKIEFLAFKIEFFAFKIEFFAFQIEFLAF